MTSLNFNDDSVYNIDNPITDNNYEEFDLKNLFACISSANISSTNDYLYSEQHEYVGGE